MSRIGLAPITIEDSVTVTVNKQDINVKGPKGEINLTLPGMLSVEVKDNEVVVARKGDSKQGKSLHGTYRSLIANAITGVKDGFSKKLEIHGVGFRVAAKGAGISLSLGLNHPVEVDPLEGVTLTVEDETTILVEGYDKQKVGEMAAFIRELKKPEPYKGKGIRYEGEYVRRKSAKAVAKA